MTTASRSTVRLASGVDMPRLGLGTWPMDDEEATRVVADAVTAGYRLVDTAFAYGNETGVGRGLRASGVDRAEVFVTSKFNRASHSIAGVAQAARDSLERLGLDYLDLLLIHWPNPAQDQYVHAWQGLVELRTQGLVRAIGVSNFKATHLDRIIDATGVAPDVNQVELSPYTPRPGIRDYASNHGAANHGIVIQAYSPLGQGNDLLAQPVVAQVAARTGCTPAQAVLAWVLGLPATVVAKSSDPQRLRENLAAADVQLSQADSAALAGLDRGEASAIDSDTTGH